MEFQSRAADVDRFLILLRPPALFGELRKRNRRRVFLDPASQVVYPTVVRHRSDSYNTVYKRVIVAVRP